MSPAINQTGAIPEQIRRQPLRGLSEPEVAYLFVYILLVVYALLQQKLAKRINNNSLRASSGTFKSNRYYR